jgi:hypothetical protein
MNDDSREGKICLWHRNVALMRTTLEEGKGRRKKGRDDEDLRFENCGELIGAKLLKTPVCRNNHFAVWGEAKKGADWMNMNSTRNP